MDSSGYLTFLLLSLTSLLAILNPLTIAPMYLSLTEGYTPSHRLSTLKTAILSGTTVLIVFALLGGTIFQVFGITIHSFRIAGGIILFGIGSDMLRAKKSGVRGTAEEAAEALEKEEIGITPLGIPMIVGPGSITTVMVLMTDARTVFHGAAVVSAILVVLGGTYLVLSVGEKLIAFLGTTGLNVMTRIMGLLVMVIAVQFVVDGGLPILVAAIEAATS